MCPWSMCPWSDDAVWGFKRILDAMKTHINNPDVQEQVS